MDRKPLWNKNFRGTPRFGPTRWRPVTSPRARSRIGLVLFTAPLLVGRVAPSLADLVPAYDEHRVATAAAGDLLLVVGLVVLGGEFWERLRALFIHRATVHVDRPRPG